MERDFRTSERETAFETQLVGMFSGLAVEGSWLFAGRLAAIVASVVSIRILTRILPQATYGDFTLLIGLVMLVCSLGLAAFSNGAVRFYFELDRQGRRQELMGTVWAAAAVASLVAAGILVLALVAYDGTPALPLLAVVFIVGGLIVTGIGQPVLNLTRRRRPYAVLSTLQAGLAPLLAAGAAYVLGADLVMVTFGYMLGSFGVGGLTLWTLSRSGDFALTQLRHASWVLLSDLVRFGSPAVLAALLAWVLSIGDRYLLRFYSDSSQVALYAVGYQAGAFAPAFFSAVFLAMVGPLIMQTFEPERKRIPNIGLWLGVYTSVAVPILGGCLMFPEVILSILTPSKVYHEAWRVVPFSAVALVLYGFEQVGAYVLHLRKRLILGLVFAAVGAVVNIGMNLVLIPRLGYMGAAMSTVIAYLFELVVAVIFTRRLFRWRVAWQWPAIGLATALTAGIISQLLRASTGPAEIPGLVWAGIYGITCVLIACSLASLARLKVDLRFFVQPSEVSW